jgi:hypothetical protein
MISQTHRDTLPKEHIMATQTRRTTRQAAKFFTAIVTAYTVNATRAWASRPVGGLKVKTHIKAGSIIIDDFNPQPDPPGVARE